jgi:hypothetical protein
MARYGFLSLAVLIGLGGLFTAYFRAQKHIRSENQNHSVLDYLLVWPLLFSKTPTDVTNGRRRRLLTTRENVGWCIVFVLMVAVVVFSL